MLDGYVAARQSIDKDEVNHRDSVLFWVECSRVGEYMRSEKIGAYN